MAIQIQDFSSKQPFQSPIPSFSPSGNRGIISNGGLASEPMIQADGYMSSFNDQLSSLRDKNNNYVFESPDTPYDTSDNTPYEFDTFINKLAGVESGGKYDAFNKGSKAYGKYQFIPSTEKYIAGQLGMPIEEARTPAGQEKMIRQLTNNNVAGLKKAGVPVTSFYMWAAHNQGLGGAINLFKGNELSKRNLASNGGVDNASYKNRWKSTFA